jgi:hypothetical protein
VSTFLLVSYIDIVEVLSKSSFENDCPSPDSSENPFLFSFKKEKIATDSWK